MGLNIIAYRVLGVEREETPFGEIVYINTEEYQNFKTTRYTGDREFALSEDIQWTHYQEDPEREYYRPKDIEETRQWVIQHIVPENQHRLLTLLDDMEKDPALHIFFSW